MKIALIQTNPIVGDFAYNCQKILYWSQQAFSSGCELAIFPEMAVSGYPPQDLLERKSFIAEHQNHIDRLKKKLPPIDVLFGCFEERQESTGKKLYNGAVVIRKGEVVFRTYKQLLPTYDVFDETRYFSRGDSSNCYSLGKHTFGVTICEDIWFQEDGDYDVEPLRKIMASAEQSGSVLSAIINISASPFQRNKEKQKHELFKKTCLKYNSPLIYVNQTGGQDSLLFDGRSFVMDSDGEITAKGPAFSEDMLIVDCTTWEGEMCGPAVDDEIEAVYKGLVMGVRDYIRKCGFQKVVLGLSGGIDSALTAAIATEALGAENVMGIALPSPYSSQGSIDDARRLTDLLNCRFEILPIADLFEGFKTTLKPLFHGLKEDLTEQNIQARIRGNLLMALSNKFNALLLTTGNKSEMAVGYCTLYGDMSGGLAVISDVPKQLVYELAHFINRNGEVIPYNTINKPPSAELKPDQLDQDDLPPYDTLDQILELHLESGLGKKEIIAQGFSESVVDDVIKRIRVNEYKRKQAPMGLKVTSKAFGYGRRIPNVQNFTE